MDAPRFGARLKFGRLKLVALALVGCVLVGVGAGTAPAQQTGGSLRVVIAGDVNVDPVTASREGQPVWGTFLDPLVKVDARGNLLKTGIIEGQDESHALRRSDEPVGMR